MAEYGKSGKKVSKRVNLCPTCGRNPSVQAMSTLDYRIPRRQKGLKPSVGREMPGEFTCMTCNVRYPELSSLCSNCGMPDERVEAPAPGPEGTCRNCGARVSKRVNLCPMCGKNPNVETITAVYERSRPRWKKVE